MYKKFCKTWGSVESTVYLDAQAPWYLLMSLEDRKRVKTGSFWKFLGKKARAQCWLTTLSSKTPAVPYVSENTCADFHVLDIRPA